MPKRKPVFLHSASRTIYHALRAWFAREARAMPWRGETDPYKIWISEVMLVQTTGTVCTKRYPSFTRRFPTVRALANAHIDEARKEWEGLGYYARIKNLHAAARTIMDQHGGEFPSRYDDIRALPGCGDYVAAAVANFAFGGRYPAVDTNVARVVARLAAIGGNPRGGRVRRRITEALEELMIYGRGALWTDSLIEVGATICAPKRPQCERCPLVQFCCAFQTAKSTAFGLTPKPPPRLKVRVACGVIRRRDGRILIAQRKETGLLPGLWEFPGGKRDGNESMAHCMARECREELGITVADPVRAMTVDHAYTHYDVRLYVFTCLYVPPPKGNRPRAIECQAFRWVKPSELSRYAFPTANRKIVAAIDAGEV